jgi:hypothetical protein
VIVNKNYLFYGIIIFCFLLVTTEYSGWFGSKPEPKRWFWQKEPEKKRWFWQKEPEKTFFQRENVIATAALVPVMNVPISYAATAVHELGHWAAMLLLMRGGKGLPKIKLADPRVVIPFIGRKYLLEGVGPGRVLPAAGSTVSKAGFIGISAAGPLAGAAFSYGLGKGAQKKAQQAEAGSVRRAVWRAMQLASWYNLFKGALDLIPFSVPMQGGGRAYTDMAQIVHMIRHGKSPG